MWSIFPAKKLNTHREFELKLAANQNQLKTRLRWYMGLTMTKNIISIFFRKNEPKPLLIQHVKGQPAASTYVQEKGGVTCYTNHETPCNYSLTNLWHSCEIVRFELILFYWTFPRQSNNIVVGWAVSVSLYFSILFIVQQNCDIVVKL